MKKIVYKQYGGKASISKWIVSHFPKHKIYLEPFCGSCSVLIAKEKSFIEIVNDLDFRLISMFRTLREQPKELAAILWATPYSPENWRESKTSEESLEDARLLIASGQQFYCGNGNTSTWAIDKCASPHKPKPSVWSDYAKRVLPFASRIKDVQILCEDAIKCIERVKDEKEALIYVDPPYIGHESEYRFKVKYDEMVDVLKSCKAKVLISEYEMGAKKFPGWDVVFKDMPGRARTGAHNTNARLKREYLIANFSLTQLKEARRG
jgi:DNA adenine methylase